MLKNNPITKDTAGHKNKSDFSKIEIVAFQGKSKQENICVYPVIDKDAEYEMDGNMISGDGIDIPVTMPYTSKTVRIKKVKGVK